MHLSKIWHQLLLSTWLMNYFPKCLNLLSLHLGVPGKHSEQAPCPHASVCPEPAALLSSFHSGLPQFHVSLNVVKLELQLLPVSHLTLYFLLLILPSPGCTPNTESTSIRCDVPALLSDIQTALLPYQFSYTLCHCSSFGKYSFE